MKRMYVTLLMILLMAQYINAQNTFPSTGSVGIGTIAPNGSAALEINSTGQGLLIPRMTKKQRDQILSPVAGLLIYQTNVNAGFYYYTGIAWVLITSNAWGINGNSGTISGTNFIGTTDAQALQFKTNNKKAGLLDFDPFKANSAFGYQSLNANTGNSNSAFGYQSLYTNSTATAGTALGVHALFSNKTGSWNTAVGAEVLYANTTGYFNTATGYFALNKNTIGDRNIANGSYALTNNTAGRLNAATGVDALYANTTGSSNVANGFEALHNNTTGNANVAMGVGALYSNIASSNNIAIGDSALYGLNSHTLPVNNVAIGSKALYKGSGSYQNIALGYATLYSNTSGGNNTAIGIESLFNNTEGYENTAVGGGALVFNSTGFENTALGSGSLENNSDGYDNTALGAYADMNNYHLSNATAVGAYAIATANNQVMLGSTTINSVRAAASFVIYSDGRFKKNIKENVPGLKFINQLKPVTYNYDIHKLNAFIQPASNADGKSKFKIPVNEKQQQLIEAAITNKEKKTYTGFVAQEVEQIANKMNYDFSGVYKPQNDNDPYGLSYADFVVPLVKAVQELSAENDSLKKNTALQIAYLQKQIDDLKVMMSSTNQVVSAASNIQTVKLNNASSLEQNIPNPYSGSTIINYTLPLKYSAAKMIITDKAGKIIKEINLTGNGKGSVQVDGASLSNGVYQYSLYVDGKMIAGKQMITSK